MRPKKHVTARVNAQIARVLTIALAKSPLTPSIVHVLSPEIPPTRALRILQWGVAMGHFNHIAVDAFCPTDSFYTMAEKNSIQVFEEKQYVRSVSEVLAAAKGAQ